MLERDGEEVAASPASCATRRAAISARTPIPAARNSWCWRAPSRRLRRLSGRHLRAQSGRSSTAAHRRRLPDPGRAVVDASRRSGVRARGHHPRGSVATDRRARHRGHGSAPVRRRDCRSLPAGGGARSPAAYACRAARSSSSWTGACRDANGSYAKGGWVRDPIGEAPALVSDGGCRLYVKRGHLLHPPPDRPRIERRRAHAAGRGSRLVAPRPSASARPSEIPDERQELEHEEHAEATW